MTLYIIIFILFSCNLSYISLVLKILASFVDGTRTILLLLFNRMWRLRISWPLLRVTKKRWHPLAQAEFWKGKLAFLDQLHCNVFDFNKYVLRHGTVAKCYYKFIGAVDWFALRLSLHMCSGPDDHVFINFADHGAPGLIAFPVTYLYANAFLEALQYMNQQQMYKQVGKNLDTKFILITNKQIFNLPKLCGNSVGIITFAELWQLRFSPQSQAYYMSWL